MRLKKKVRSKLMLSNELSKANIYCLHQSNIISKSMLTTPDRVAPIMCPKNLVRSVPKSLHVTLAKDRTFFSLLTVMIMPFFISPSLK